VLNMPSQTASIGLPHSENVILIAVPQKRMVIQTHLNVALYVHFLFCWSWLVSCIRWTNTATFENLYPCGPGTESQEIFDSGFVVGSPWITRRRRRFLFSLNLTPAYPPKNSLKINRHQFCEPFFLRRHACHWRVTEFSSSSLYSCFWFWRFLSRFEFRTSGFAQKGYFAVVYGSRTCLVYSLIYFPIHYLLFYHLTPYGIWSIRTFLNKITKNCGS
jgi:hypothetical protein